MTPRSGRYFTIPAANEVRVPPGLQTRVVMRDQHRCVYCGDVVGTFQVDHVRPCAHYPRGAAISAVNAPFNLVTACPACNRSKGPQDLTAFAAMLEHRGLPRDVVDSKLRRVQVATALALPRK